MGSDVVAFGRRHAKNGWFTFTQRQNRNRKPVTLSIPVLPPLQAAIDTGPCGDLTYLVTEFRRPFSSNGFGNNSESVRSGRPAALLARAVQSAGMHRRREKRN